MGEMQVWINGFQACTWELSRKKSS